MNSCGLWSLLILGGVTALAASTGASRPNILFITVDDMNYDTPASFGGKVADITPHIDRLAREGRRFYRAHVPVAVCQPSRQCIMTGSYPQANGSTGFYPLASSAVTLPECLRAAGYRLGILGKVDHLLPVEKFPWDDQHDMHELGAGRDPERYHRLAAGFFAQARAQGRPFFLMTNSHDPHRPWPGAGNEKPLLGREVRASAARLAKDVPEGPAPPFDIPLPARTYAAEAVPVPGFLPDLPDVRNEMGQYYTAAHRADQAVGRILDALRESGLEDDTIVIFLSDNGISMPFAKSNCYLASTHTPLIIRWPGRTQAGSADTENFISGVDLMPTLLEGLGLPAPAGIQGRSLLPVLGGGTQPGRDHVFTCYNDNVSKTSFTMRCRQDARFGYIYNAWADGKKEYKVEALLGLTFPAMQATARQDPAVASRVEMLLHRTPEEFYDLQRDPDALNNLARDPRYQEQLKQARAELLAWMKETGDPAAATLASYLADHTSNSPGTGGR